MDQQVLVPKSSMGLWPALKQKLGIQGCQLQDLELKWVSYGDSLGTAQTFESFQDQMGRWKISPFETKKTMCTEGSFGNSTSHWPMQRHSEFLQ